MKTLLLHVQQVVCKKLKHPHCSSKDALLFWFQAIHVILAFHFHYYSWTTIILNYHYILFQEWRDTWEAHHDKLDLFMLHNVKFAYCRHFQFHIPILLLNKWTKETLYWDIYIEQWRLITNASRWMIRHSCNLSSTLPSDWLSNP